MTATATSRMIRIVLPSPLRALVQVGGEIGIEVTGDVMLRTVLDAIEARHPMLLGTMRDHTTKQRRAFVRFFACERDLSQQSPDEMLPATVADGREPLLIIGAMAGG